ncbi:hypothetical protein [Flexivirga caeni]|uniref:hypothetical protein n=1 Tax=Flexivirga caeni TaxID=2294115 RepID=UPI001C656603|nr:hypothetical protein [Flexivirga caeni]
MTETERQNFLADTGAATRKARLIREAGRVTLTVQREEPPCQYVIVEGSIVDAVTPTPRQVREKIAIRYLGPEAGRSFTDAMNGADSVLFTIRPGRWITQDFSE